MVKAHNIAEVARHKSDVTPVDARKLRRRHKAHRHESGKPHFFVQNRQQSLDALLTAFSL
jgi:hypothetical protein